MCCYRQCWQGCSCGGQQGIPEPRGPIGPQGPVGPQGPSGTSGVAGFINPTSTLTAVVQMPLNNLVNLTDGDVTHIDGSSTVVLNPGTYLVNYTTTATSATAGVVGLGLQLNGATVLNPQETLVNENDTTNLSGQYIVNVPVGTTSTINLLNTGANTTTYTGTTMTVQELTT